MSENKFVIEVAPNARSKCKKSKVKIEKGELRIGKIGPNPFKEGLLTNWFKVEPFFEAQLRMRKTTEKLESSDDLSGYAGLSDEHKQAFDEALENYLSTKDKPKPKASKRKAKEEKGSGKKTKKAKGSPKKKAKKKSDAKESDDPQKLFEDVDPTIPPKKAAAALKKVARNLGFPLPEDEIEANIKCGQMIMGHKTEDGKTEYLEALKALANELQCPEKIPGGKKKKKRPAPKAEIDENQGLVDSFWDLASFEFKHMMNTMKGISYQKVARALASYGKKVSSGVKLSKGKEKLPGVGKASAAKIDEYLENGKIERLERYRQGDFIK
mmetsp:Transcript_26423/g.63765  ORF Transcript_26423/g.63765 Transcript_26423/m.63765 type:complete len:326 (+) Transcript_26423:188-1165(+)|eukprot:CAMPEP_0114496432 /NCGR_PEP_ID=MMETSP0109-20121206/5767_1 /TAXON_ID=29199 /ORGANISM="Chlorarachnion reptans, Strain CCCM449" /LENGTH=325 /DNA_ID=CAMNT_0001673705 /DNA_START=114 /DNA_END=1091 /DNA_ORIENTATION=-